ncbi:hypothetical protein LRR81_04195 [Metabacillus sp. GX 13764]|uniref:hypothetical protein n=1 Tax=Metabacillus kandeliae TaxID=2900151 RepID=UPI001E3AC844|nr:hypothetical protein [Metabacillus kandeliae]MCD7033420.1 hypothetical protein [Metabacillus kandeliae]
MLKDQDFQLISKALISSYECLSKQDQECAGIQSLGSAQENLMKAMAHAASIDHKMLVQSLFDRNNGL